MLALSQRVALNRASAAQPHASHRRRSANRAVRLRCRAEGTAAVEEAPATAAVETAAATLQKAREVAELALESYQYRKANDSVPEDVVAALKHKLDAVERELGAVTEEQYARLTTRESLEAARSTPILSVDQLVSEIQQQHRAVPAAGGVQHNIVPLPLTPGRKLDREVVRPEGTGEEVLLQGFNWDSWQQQGGWWNHVKDRAEEFAQMGFTSIWLPPPTQSVSKQGYMPGDLYNLNSEYGTEEELKACVSALQAQGIKVLADAVLNHRCAQHQDEHGVWNKYGGRLAWDQRAIVGDDPHFRGRGNRSSGDIFGAAPNIDHSQEFVKRDLQEWLRHLRATVGYDGFRLDFVRGFAGSHVRDYMEASKPQFAVGEYWDALAYEWDGTPCHNQDGHRQRIVDWINGAGGLATAFDITTKGILHGVFERCEYWRLRDASGKPAGLLGWWPSRSVTFLENHDTGSSQGHWRFPGHALEQGYAYILTHPGTPCVFYDHLVDQRLRDTCSRLMALRKRARIHARSQISILRAERDVYAAEIEGKAGKLLMKIGPGDFCPHGDGWTIADCGQNWAVWELKH